MKYQVNVNFFLEKEKEEYTAGDVVEMEKAKADDINVRAEAIHPTLGKFLTALEEPEEKQKKPSRKAKKEVEGADE
ncbi:hypothetical protein JDW15_06205 [Aerococcaceae bacterium zg-ZJ1578]|uniref:hypothetical protein n=1 Tax=Aerococcaceae bacterium zg-252 TaxID=2796928 RepID=UPI001A1D268C|nr:hypothetical protein [Aerococcaceae bacterium zg-1578]